MSFTLDEPLPVGRTIILTGPSGCGKTSFATRFPRPYVIDVDRNLVGAKRTMTKEGRDAKLVKGDYIHIDDSGKEVPMIARFARLLSLIQKSDMDDTIDTRIVDSTSSLVPVFKAEVCRQNNKPADALLEGWNQWGQFEVLWNKFLDWLLGSKKLNIIVAHEQPEKGEMDQVLRYALAIPGKSSEQLPRLVSDVFVMSVETKIVGQELKPFYYVTTVQNPQRPNIKTSLDLPLKFEATQEWVDKIVKQIKP